MNKGILGRKIGTTQIFDGDGNRFAVTVVEAGPCTVIQKKSAEKEGYASLQIGYGEKKAKKVNKPESGHYKKSGASPKKHLREFRFCEEVYSALKEGDELTVEQFENGDFIDVTSKSKGKGFAGVMKRYNFRGRPATHGTHENFRGPGSIGMHQTPGRVYKNKKLPGQMGNKDVTVQNLSIVKIDKEKKLLFVKGDVPGSYDSLVIIRDSVKKPSFPFYVKDEQESRQA
ncbi:MAG: 50S ribosomal protein L3 [Oligoflexia bacterium]|nr:50S ribosomal protein L3 [Oligoflexia bacterium]